MAKKNINQTAVQNFLMSLDLSMSIDGHKKKARYDMDLYKWSPATYLAIIEGIENAYIERKKLNE